MKGASNSGVKKVFLSVVPQLPVSLLMSIPDGR